MNSTTWTDAPAGFSGPGSIGMSQYACAPIAGGRMAPVAAPIRGTGLPVAVRRRLIDERGAAPESFLLQVGIGIAPLSATTKNNGTTLGIHPPGRSQS